MMEVELNITIFSDGNFGGRYSDILRELLGELGAVKVLREEFENDWQGFVDVDILLNDGRVYSFYYSYGSCSGCDAWEANNYSEETIKQEMKNDASYFDNIDHYNTWRELIRKQDEQDKGE